VEELLSSLNVSEYRVAPTRSFGAPVGTATGEKVIDERGGPASSSGGVTPGWGAEAGGAGAFAATPMRMDAGGGAVAGAGAGGGVAGGRGASTRTEGRAGGGGGGGGAAAVAGARGAAWDC
jgi:hypothetical protein